MHVDRGFAGEGQGNRDAQTGSYVRLSLARAPSVDPGRMKRELPVPMLVERWRLQGDKAAYIDAFRCHLRIAGVAPVLEGGHHALDRAARA